MVKQTYTFLIDKVELMDSKKVERFALYTGKSCCFLKGDSKKIYVDIQGNFEETC